MKFINIRKLVKLILTPFFLLGLTVSCHSSKINVSFEMDIPANMAQSESVKAYLHGFNYYLSQDDTIHKNMTFSFRNYAADAPRNTKSTDSEIEIVIASSDFDVSTTVPVMSPFFKPHDVIYDDRVPHFPMTNNVRRDTNTLLELGGEHGLSAPLVIYSDETLYEESYLTATEDLDVSFNVIKIEKDTINFEGVFNYISGIESDGYFFLLNHHDFVSLYYHLVAKKSVVPIYLPSFITRYYPTLIYQITTFPVHYLMNTPFVSLDDLLSEGLLTSSYYLSLIKDEQMMMIRQHVYFGEGLFVAALIMDSLNEVNGSSDINTALIGGLHRRYKELSFGIEAYNK